MEKEFKLYEEIQKLYIKSDDGKISTGKVEDLIKEFIKRLKAKMFLCGCTKEDYNEYVIKIEDLKELVGDKLT